MANDNKTPAIRFKGFTDTWEQRKCSDFIKLVGGATPSKANKDYWDGDIVWLSSQEIKGGFVSKGTYNITQKAVDDNTTKMIPANTPMFISRSGILANSFPITRALCNVAINQDIKALLFDHTVFSNDYIVHYLESKEQFILKSIVKSGTTVQSISIPDFEKMPINIPASKDEQDRIGIYFENLDTLITLHQRKYDKLIQFKAAMLQKMFPQNGADKPEIRFKGFTDAWEQRKLEEVITVGNGMDYKHLPEGDIPVYGTGGYMLSVDKALSYDKDAIGIGRKGTIDKPYVLKAPFWTVDTLFYCIPKEDYSLDFVYCIFQNVNWKEKDESTGVPSLSKVNINSTDVKVPTLAEQEKIGAYFAQLDNLITLHQRKCDKYKSIKAGLIRKLFP